MRWPPDTPAQVIRQRRRTLVFGAALIASNASIDLALGHGPRALVHRAGWIAFVLLGALLQREARPALAYAGAQLASLATGIYVVVLVWITGGTQSIYAAMLLVTPYAVLVAIPDLPSPAITAGLLCGTGGVAMRQAEGEALLRVISWSILSAVMTALAAWGAIASRRSLLAQLAAERARRVAVENLAESERVRAEAERLAEVGRLAATVAHEVNNPLAVVKSNVSWLGGAESEFAGGAERSEVIASTLENVERLIGIVLKLRTAAGLRPVGRPKQPG